MVPYFPVGGSNPNIAALRNIFPNETIDDDNGAGMLSSNLFLASVLATAVVVTLNIWIMLY